ncbi:MAG: PfkB family carbohydrate kinase [Planctomycetota bacterium]|jgi:ribokinase
MAERIPKIVVIGPAFIDMAVKCETHPTPGKVVEGNGFTTIPAGTGVNEAIQVALCGCETYLLARVGEDCFGELIRQHLERHHVQTDLVYPTQAMSTGIIVTVVDGQGENCGCRSFGANRILGRDEIDCAAAEQQIGSADAILIDDTIAHPAAVAAIRSAQIHKTRVVLSARLPRPNREVVQVLDWPMEFYNTDILVLSFQGMSCVSELGAGGEGELKFIGAELIARGAKCVVMSLGWRGALVIDRQGLRHLEGIASEVVDQNGCDSAFTGALTACFGTGDPPDRAVRFAIAAESIQRGRFGLQESLPRKEEIVTVLQSQPD